jgi:methylated-DNA-[protein]-cysteine S-methyltransferase
MKEEILYSSSFHSPIGLIRCKATDLGLREIKILGDSDLTLQRNDYHSVLNATQIQLEEYFEGTRTSFDLPYDFGEATKFFKMVWNILLAIPYGQTRTYGDIAFELGDIQKSRAVGMANAKNRIPIIVPCHRVIGGNNALTGYAYGLDMKLFLLKLENPAKWSEQTTLFK